MSRRLNTYPPQESFRILVAATLADSTSRLAALEAEESARRARRRFVMGNLTEEALADRLAQLAKARRAAADAAFWRRHCELKFNPDQPRDDQGRWTSGGGGGQSSSSRSHRGDLSMEFEVSYRPGREANAAGIVSSGKDDAGGVSYGAFQLSSEKGQVQSFLKSTGAQWASEFNGLDPTEPGGAFGQTWKTIAARDPVNFLAAQESYIQATHYDPVVQRVLKATGLDINSRPLAVQQVVWSMAVQHGRAAKIIKDAVCDLDHWTSPTQPGYDSALINNLFDFREKYVIKNRVDKLSSVLNRYKSERRRALSLLGGG